MGIGKLGERPGGGGQEIKIQLGGGSGRDEDTLVPVKTKPRDEAKFVNAREGGDNVGEARRVQRHIISGTTGRDARAQGEFGEEGVIGQDKENRRQGAALLDSTVDLNRIILVRGENRDGGDVLEKVPH